MIFGSFISFDLILSGRVLINLTLLELENRMLLKEGM
jgi:hypothetical protein